MGRPRKTAVAEPEATPIGPPVKFYVPSIGDVVRLTQPWEFPCFHEGRNFDFARQFDKTVKTSYSWSDDITGSTAVTLPVGIELRIDRIYIRKGKSEWDSITFWIAKGCAKKFGIKGRFWAKLADVNEIECVLLSRGAT